MNNNEKAPLITIVLLISSIIIFGFGVANLDGCGGKNKKEANQNLSGPNMAPELKVVHDTCTAKFNRDNYDSIVSENICNCYVDSVSSRYTRHEFDSVALLSPEQQGKFTSEIVKYCIDQYKK